MYSVGTTNGVALQGLDPRLESMSQCDIFPQNSSYPSTRETDVPPISSLAAAYFPEPDECWPQITQHAGLLGPQGPTGQSPRYLMSFRPCAHSSALLQRRQALPETCISHQGFLQPSGRPRSNGYCTCNAVIWEPTPTAPLPGMNSSFLLGANSYFSNPRSSGIMEQTVSDHLFYINTPSEGVVQQSSGSLADKRIPSFTPDKPRYSSWGSQ